MNPWICVNCPLVWKEHVKGWGFSNLGGSKNRGSYNILADRWWLTADRSAAAGVRALALPSTTRLSAAALTTRLGRMMDAAVGANDSCVWVSVASCVQQVYSFIYLSVFSAWFRMCETAADKGRCYCPCNALLHLCSCFVLFYLFISSCIYFQRGRVWVARLLRRRTMMDVCDRCLADGWLLLHCCWGRKTRVGDALR